MPNPNPGRGPVAAPSRWPWPRRRRVLGLVGVAAVCVAGGAVGSWAGRPGGPLLVAQVLDHPLLFAALALTALAAAVLTGLRNRVVRALVVSLAALGVLLALPLLLVLASTGREVTMSREAPGGVERRLVVEEGSAAIDPVWWVHVDDGSWLTRRRWPVGCFNGDAPDNALLDASWTGPHRIRLVIGEEGDERVHLIDLSPTDGRPLRTLSTG